MPRAKAVPLHDERRYALGEEIVAVSFDADERPVAVALPGATVKAETVEKLGALLAALREARHDFRGVCFAHGYYSGVCLGCEPPPAVPPPAYPEEMPTPPPAAPKPRGDDDIPF